MVLHVVADRPGRAARRGLRRATSGGASYASAGDTDRIDARRTGTGEVSAAEAGIREDHGHRGGEQCVRGGHGKRTDAPYLNALADQFGLATNYDAGYPVNCPSLPAYLLMTQGTTGGICDNGPPRQHPLGGDNIFHQVAGAGLQRRAYAESMPGTASRKAPGTTPPNMFPPPTPRTRHQLRPLEHPARDGVGRSVPG
jgi:hypothetical protein